MKYFKQVLIYCVVNYVCYSNGGIYSKKDYQNDGGYIREKRQALNPESKFPAKFWDQPIKYAIDNSYKPKFVNIILQALKHIEDNTCVRFQKINKNFDGKHIVFLNEAGCASAVGEPKDKNVSTVFASANVCRPFFGVVVRLLTHVLGFFNEENRLDSPKFITINKGNIIPQRENAFMPWPRPNEIQNFGVPYDYSSIMHFSGRAFAEDISIPTIVAKDPLFQTTMGQRMGLSFYDINLINLAYCKNSCRKPLNCKRKGITLPPSCKKCICPDGYGGTLCDTVGKSDPGCSLSALTTLLVTSTEQCIQSPNYGSGTYDVNSICNWILKAPSKKKIQMRFTGKFSVYQVPFIAACFHWVEIKFRGTPLETVGPRFCGKKRPTKVLISDGNEAVISFRSNIETELNNRGGFRLCYKLQGRERTGSSRCVVRFERSKYVGQCRSTRSCRFSCENSSCAPGQVCCFKKKNKPPQKLC